MALFNDTITIGVEPELTSFERKIVESAARAARSIKPMELRFNTGSSQPLGKITSDISQFNKSIDAAAARVLAFTSTVAIVNGVIGTFRSLVKETIEVEKALTDINVVLNTNAQGLESFKKSLFDIARNTGQSFKAVTQAATEFSRQGLGIEKTLQATNAALLLTRLAGLDAADSVKTLTSAMNGFNKEALTYESIVNKLANVDANFAVSTKDLAEALTRVGSTASEAKVSFDELVAAVTAVQQTTSRGGAVIGNAFKTIFTRITREDTVKQLKELGVQIDESASGIDKLKSIAATIKDVDQATANTIKELAGGVFQINVVSAALGDLSKGYSIYESALKAANQETASAVLRNDALNKTLDALTKQAGANIQELLSNIGKISLGDNLKGLFGTFNTIVSSISEAIDGEDLGAKLGQGIIKGVGNFLTGPAAIIALGTFLRLVVKVGSDAFNAFKQFSGVAGQAEKIAILQESIGKKVERNTGYYQQQLATGKSLESVQKAILRDLEREFTLRSSMAKISSTVSKSTLLAAANQYNLVKDEKGNNLVRKASLGYVPAMASEQHDVLAGVGGASPSSRAVLIPSFNFGDKRGPIVANTSEKIVDNWMGGKGSAVLNPDMISALGGEAKLTSYGKVRNVAEGFVPNLASYNIAGGRVNLKHRGESVILDEILAGFDEKGNRLEGTGIVKQAFDLAVTEGKRLGAKSLVVDILNSRVAASLNGNPKFSGFGPFGRGKFKIPIMNLAGGYMPEQALTPEVLESFGKSPAGLIDFVDRLGLGSKIKVGSSRAYVPLGAGRGLKFAINKAGIAQNEREFSILDNPKAQMDYGDILPKIYDYDRKRAHFGYVEALKPASSLDFLALGGVKKDLFLRTAGRFPKPVERQIKDFLAEYKLTNDFTSDANGNIDNIGVGVNGTQRALKLLDVGFDDAIFRKFYQIPLGRRKFKRDLGNFAEGLMPTQSLTPDVLNSFSKNPRGLMKFIKGLGLGDGLKMGSSRAFVDVGGGKGLKFAINRAGLAQNEKEFSILREPFAREKYGSILPNVYEHDKENSTFGFVDKLDRPDAKEFRKLAGVNKRDFLYTSGRLASDFEETVRGFMADYGLRNDFQNGRNMGVGGMGADRSLKLFDIGFDDDVAQRFYGAARQKRDLGKFAVGYVPNLASLFDVTGVLGNGIEGSAYSLRGRKGLPQLAFKKFKEVTGFGLERSAAISKEFEQFKMLEGLGINTAKIFGSKERSIARGGIVKERMDGFIGRELGRELPKEDLVRLKEDIHEELAKKGVKARDVHVGNIAIDDSYTGVVDTYNNEGYDAFKKRVFSKMKIFDGEFKMASEGFIPHFNSALRDAIYREQDALIGQGYPEGAVKQSIRVGSAPNLVNERNPSGYGVYNLLQGQTSLKKAFTDHNGQDLKTVGAAGGHIPSFVTPFKQLKGASGASVPAKFLKEVNDALASLSTSSNIEDYTAQVTRLEFLASSLSAKTQKVVARRANVAGAEALNSPNAFFEKDASDPSGKKTSLISKEKDVQIRALLRTASATRSPIEAELVTKEIDEIAKGLTKASADSVKKTLKGSLSVSKNARGVTEGSIGEIERSIEQKIARRGLLSPTTGRGLINENLADINRLPERDRTALEKRIRESASADRAQKFKSASLGLSIGASIAAPLIDVGANAARENESPNAANLLSAGSSTLNGFSLGAQFGPVAAGVGAAAGAIYGLVDALDQTDDRAAKLAKTFEDLASSNAALVNGFSSYVDVQQRLSSVIESGGKERDIQALQRELSNTFAAISDPDARKSILEAGSDIKKLYDTLGRVSDKALKGNSIQGALAATSAKRDKLTTLGVVTDDNFDQKTIGAIAQSFSQSIDRDKLAATSAEIEKLSQNLTESGFVSSFEKLGVTTKEAKQLFDDLLTTSNRFRLLGDIKRDLDFSEELRRNQAQTVKYKTSLVELNKVLSAVVGIQTSNRKTQLGFENNAFGVNQNQLKGEAANKFFNASEFARAQLSTAFDVKEVQFNAEQEKSGVLNDLQESIANFVTQNRTVLKQDGQLSKALTELSTAGKGDLESLVNRSFSNAVGKGEESKGFTELSSILNDSKNKLDSINNKAGSQVTILQQNLATLKERLAIENRINVLGGAEGQIGFRTRGLEGFGDRQFNTQTAALGGRLGSFGRSENAQGILEFQKTFGQVEGLDVRSLIPNAQQIVQDSIKESMIEGLGRINVGVTPERLGEIDKISALSAAKQFERRELTAQEIGDQVGKQFNYDKMAAGTGTSFTTALTSSGMPASTAFVPEIYNFLKARFSVESERLSVQEKLQATEASKSEEKGRVANARTNISKVQMESGVVSAPGKLTDFFSDIVLKNVANQNPVAYTGLGAYGVTNNGMVDEKGTSQRVNEYLRLKVLNSGEGPQSFDKTVARVNDALTPNFLQKINPDVGLAQQALLQEFGGQGGLDAKNNLNEVGKRLLAEKLNANGVLEVTNKEAAQKVFEYGQIIAKSTTSLAELDSKIPVLKSSIEALDQQLEAITARAQKKPSIAVGNFLDFNSQALPAFNTSIGGTTATQTALPSFDDAISTSRTRAAKEASQQASVKNLAEAEAAQKENELRERLRKRFGNVDGNDFRTLIRAEDENAAAPNRTNAGKVNASRITILRQAQQQAFDNNGVVAPEFSANEFGGGKFSEISKQLSAANAEATFKDIVDNANKAFVEGFATDGDLKKIGVRINQQLEDYVRTRVKLGDTQDEAEKAGKKMRETIEKELKGIKVEIPTNKVGEFAQGYTARLEELQRSFDDLGALGAQTADSLTNGFGDAFFEIASGAKSAEDAIRGMLSSVAADISKFFAKRAFAQIFAAAAGNESAGSFGKLLGKANGGLLKYAQGGRIPALVMGGERKFGPDVVEAFGPDFFHDLNAGKIQKHSGGGNIKGGSGYKDDVFGMFDPGTFILQKSAVNKYGPEYLDQIEQSAKYAKGGKVQKAFLGALLGAIFSKAIAGAAVGAATAKLTGGDWKKGAILGGVVGGVAGGIGGFGAAKGATGSFGSQFGKSFSNGFGYLGFGDKGGSAQAGSSSSSPTPSFGGQSNASTPDLSFNNSGSMAPQTGQGLLAQTNGGFSTGLGNQSLTAAQTATKPNAYKTAAANLGVSLALALASGALAPNTDKGSNVVKGAGSITTYNSDGSVAINTSSGTKTIKRTDYSSSSQLSSLVTSNGGQLPAAGIPSLAAGGEVGSGSGSIAYKDRSILSQINKSLASGYAMGGPVYQKPVGMFSMGGETGGEEFHKALSPYIVTGSGTKDDVNIKATKGEFVMKKEAVDYYGPDFMKRLNNMEAPQKAAGVLTMMDGGPTEYSPADRDKGLFSLSGVAPSQSTPAVPSVGSGGGGNTNIDIVINMNGSNATVETKSSTDNPNLKESGGDPSKFATKFKAMFAELVEQEKRPGGSLSREALA